MRVAADDSDAARLTPRIDDSPGLLVFVADDHPEVGPVRLPGNPIKMSSMDGIPSRPAPRVGEHADEVLGELLGGAGGGAEEEEGGEIARETWCGRRDSNPHGITPNGF